jgi:hypothetical protein
MNANLSNRRLGWAGACRYDNSGEEVGTLAQGMQATPMLENDF